MAIWQFTFDLVPREAVERWHGPDVLSLEAFGGGDSDAWDEDKTYPDYWEGRSPLSYAAAMERLLPVGRSWNRDDLMFGDDEGDDIVLGTMDIRVRLDLRNFKPELARGIVDLAAAEDLMLAVGQTGRLIPPVYDKLIREIGRSRAAKFIADPIATLRMIGREQE